jgi:hypothetical protein
MDSVRLEKEELQGTTKKCAFSALSYLLLACFVLLLSFAKAVTTRWAEREAVVDVLLKSSYRCIEMYCSLDDSSSTPTRSSESHT